MKIQDTNKHQIYHKRSIIIVDANHLDFCSKVGLVSAQDSSTSVAIMQKRRRASGNGTRIANKP